MNKKIITSFHSLRVLGFIFIFINHIKDFLPFNIPDLGARGVEIFFILSGFTMAYKHSTSTIQPSLKSCFDYSYKRAKKFYPIHIITFVLALILIYLNKNINSINITTSFLNLLLLQSWIPSIKFSFNGVSWFLSTLLFCYFMTPIILTIIRKLKTTLNISLMIIMIVLVKILFESIWIQYINWENGFMFHVFPLYKITEYSLGCLLGFIFINIQKNIENANMKILSAFQILSIMFYFLAVLIGYKSNWNRCIYIPFVLLFIFTIAINSGFIYKLLSNKISLHFSTISLELFMFHQIILNYVVHFFPNNSKLFIILLTLIVTLILCEFIHYIQYTFKNIAKNK